MTDLATRLRARADFLDSLYPTILGPPGETARLLREAADELYDLW